MDFFYFPEEYQVTKPLSVSDFLLQANLKSNELQSLKNTISYIEIMYDLPDELGNELVIICAEIHNLLKSSVSPDYIATVIARSIPHSVLVTLSLGDNAKLYVFDARQNKIDEMRNVVDSVASSDWFTSSSPEHYIKNAISKIQETEFPLASVDETLQYWMQLLHESRANKRTWDYKFSVINEAEKGRRLSLRGARDLPSAKEQLKPWLDNGDIEYQKQFIETLAYYSAVIYDEYRNSLQWLILDQFDEYLQDNEKEQWIWDYLCICEQMIEEEFERNIFDVEIKTILEAFYGDIEIELAQESIPLDYLNERFEDLRSFL